MACRLAGAKPLSAPMLEYFCQENAFENVNAVWKMTAILFRPQYVNPV